MVKVRGIQIVKEQAANSALLVTMLQIEVVIAPFFIARINLCAEGLAQIVSRAMPVNRILLKAVEGRQVKPAAEPPHRLCAGLLSNEKTHVGMAGRHIGIPRMYHQRNPHRLKAATGQFRAMRRCRSRHGVAVNVGEVYARLLKHAAIAQNPAATAAAAFALPAVFDKFTAVNGAQFLANGLLELEEIAFYLLRVGLHLRLFEWAFWLSNQWK